MTGKQVRCPNCGRLLCKVRLSRGGVAVIETICTRCRKAVSIEVTEQPA